MKKLFAVLLAVAMLLSLGVTAFAATAGTIVVADPPEGVEYIAFKIFDASVTDGKVTYTIADDSPWFDILFEEDAEGNIVGKDDAINFKVSTDTTPYTVEAEEGYSAADFAAWVMGNVTDWPTEDVYESAKNDTTGAVEITDGGNALPEGYYLIAPLQAHATADSTNFSYTGTDMDDWISQAAYNALDPAERRGAYEEVDCYYATDDDTRATPISVAYVEAVGSTGYTAGKAYTRAASIDADTFRALDKTYQNQYTSDASNFAIKDSAKNEKTATEFEALTDPEKALYTSFAAQYASDGTYVAKDLYDLMSDAQKAQYPNAGTAYKTKDTITSTQYMALGQSDTASVRALQANYDGVPNTQAGSSPDTSKVAALTTVLSDRVTQIQNKNDMPLDKEVENISDGETGGYDDNETAVKVGDILNYKISTKIPANYADGKEYEFLVTDTMSKGLTFNDDIVIKIGNDEDNPDIEISLKNRANPTASVNKDATAVDLNDANAVYDAIGELFELVTTDKTLSGNEIRYGDEEGEPTFELSIATWSHALRQYAGMPLTITYSATVNDNAKGQLVQNAAVLEYTDENGLHVKDAETDNYIARIVIDKFETGNRSQKLPGAVFVLYKVVDESTGAKKYYHFENNEVTWVDDITAATPATTDENGFAEFLYLEDGTYYLRETEAPVDYARLLDDIEIVVDGSDAVDHRLTQAQRDNILSPVANVANTPGTSMPSTGGVGATLLTIGGVALMLAAGAFLILRRKEQE